MPDGSELSVGSTSWQGTGIGVRWVQRVQHVGQRDRVEGDADRVGQVKRALILHGDVRDVAAGQEREPVGRHHAVVLGPAVVERADAVAVAYGSGEIELKSSAMSAKCPA